jgi:hypothetical protein
VYLVNRGLPEIGTFNGPDFGPAPGSYYVASVTLDDAALEGRMRVDASSATGPLALPTAASPVCVGLGFGSSISPNALDGDIAELLVFDRALSASELESLESYLRRKWGL